MAGFPKGRDAGRYDLRSMAENLETEPQSQVKSQQSEAEESQVFAHQLYPASKPQPQVASQQSQPEKQQALSHQLSGLLFVDEYLTEIWPSHPYDWPIMDPSELSDGSQEVHD